ncbi:MAG: MarR family transcriptional regulator [Mycobacterium sp.]|nr:MarR family transcriptional regulator [Mycobacterium sp.]
MGRVGDGAENGMDDAQRVDLGVALFIPYRYMEDRMFRAIQQAGFDDWTLAQVRVFQRIAPDGSRLTDLADQAQVSKQSAGVLVDQLERLGYVRRVPDPTDGRARLIVIEERGRRAAEVATATSAEILAEWTAYLGTRNFTLLHQILDQLREITDPYAHKPYPRCGSTRDPRALATHSGRRASLALDIVRSVY